MPTSYAHWAFGRECIKKMPNNLQQIVQEHRDIFDLGVHGPDIFFYDLLHKQVPHYGAQIHSIPASVFFKKCKEVLSTHEEKAEMLAYIMGFLTHFTFDSTAHGYVERKRESAGISHNKVEAQFDRYMIELDGRKSNLVDRAESLNPNKDNARIISYFFTYDKKTVLRTCKWQKFVVHTLSSISPKKQAFFQKLLWKLGANDYADLFVGFEEEDVCRDSNLRLYKLSNKALKLFPSLMKNLLNYFNDKEQLNEYFEHDFEAWPDYKKITILPYKKEIEYKV